MRRTVDNNDLACRFRNFLQVIYSLADTSDDECRSSLLRLQEERLKGIRDAVMDIEHELKKEGL